MIFYITLHRLKVFDKITGSDGNTPYLIKQKDLMEFGLLQLGSSAVAASLEGEEYATGILILLVFAWVTIPYLIMTLVQGNCFGWVRKDLNCFIYVGIVYAISVGTRIIVDIFEAGFLEAAIFIVSGAFIALLVFVGEYRRNVTITTPPTTVTPPAI